jgi:hypothetical protein
VAYKPLLEQHYTRIRDFAPYAASVLKLYLSFIGGLGRGFIGPRPSHYVDLQYLFYAPFCMVFVSEDKFHGEMWQAASGRSTFVWGHDLKADLNVRFAARKEMTEEQLIAHGEKYGFYPVEIEGSSPKKRGEVTAVPTVRHRLELWDLFEMSSNNHKAEPLGREVGRRGGSAARKTARQAQCARPTLLPQN